MPGGLNSGLEGYPFLVYTCYGNKMLFVVEFLSFSCRVVVGRWIE